MPENLKASPAPEIDVVAEAKKEKAKKEDKLKKILAGSLETIPCSAGGMFVLKPDALYFIKLDQDGEIAQERKVSDYCKVIGRYSNDEGDDLFGRIIEYRNERGKLITKYLDKGFLTGNDRGVESFLGRSGLDISPRGQYQGGKIADYLLIAGKSARWFNVSTRLGWKGSEGVYCYCLPNRVIGQDEQNEIFLSDKLNMDGMKCKGTLEEWKANIARPALTSNYLMFSIAVALAAPLIDICGGYVDSGFFEIKGGSSSGKSFSLTFAQSVTGYRESLLSWDMTKNAASMFGFAHNANLLILDELGTAPKVSDLLRMVYNLANGTSKGVGTTEQKTRKQNTWKLFGLTSGEVTLRQLAAADGLEVKAGQYLRLVPIEVIDDKLFDRGFFDFPFRNSNEFSEFMAGKFTAAYGVAFEEWISRLVRLRNDFKGEEDQLREDLIKEIRRFIEEATDGAKINAQVERVLRRFGLIAAAIELASGGLSQYLDDAVSLTGWNKGDGWGAVLRCARIWMDDYGSLSLNQEIHAIVERVKDILETELGRMIPNVRGAETGIKPNKALGYFQRPADPKDPNDANVPIESNTDSDCDPNGAPKKEDDKGIIYYIPTKQYLKEFCQGENPKSVDKVLEDNQILLRGFNAKKGIYEINAPTYIRPLQRTIRVRKMKLPDDK